MNNNTSTAKSYGFIVENDVSYNTFTRIDESADKLPEGVLMRLKGTFIPMNVAGENGRWYTYEDYAPHVLLLQEKIKRKELWGEIEHPQRVHVPYDLASHRIDKVYFDQPSNSWVGEISVLDTVKGRDVYNIARTGAPIYVSHRALGSSDPKTGKGVILKLLTWDVTSNPSFKRAEFNNAQLINESFSLIPFDSDFINEGLHELGIELGDGIGFEHINESDDKKSVTKGKTFEHDGKKWKVTEVGETKSTCKSGDVESEFENSYIVDSIDCDKKDSKINESIAVEPIEIVEFVRNSERGFITAQEMIADDYTFNGKYLHPFDLDNGIKALAGEGLLYDSDAKGYDPVEPQPSSILTVSQVDVVVTKEQSALADQEELRDKEETANVFGGASKFSNESALSWVKEKIDKIKEWLNQSPDTPINIDGTDFFIDKIKGDEKVILINPQGDPVEYSFDEVYKYINSDEGVDKLNINENYNKMLDNVKSILDVAKFSATSDYKLLEDGIEGVTADVTADLVSVLKANDIAVTVNGNKIILTINEGADADKDKDINEGADADKDKDINEGADADKDKDINEGAEADKDKDINEGADADKDKDINEGADADKDKDINEMNRPDKDGFIYENDDTDDESKKLDESIDMSSEKEEKVNDKGEHINEGADADKDKDINEGVDADKDKDINEGADADKDKDINEGADADKDKDINEGADAEKDKDINETETDVRADGNAIIDESATYKKGDKLSYKGRNGVVFMTDGKEVVLEYDNGDLDGIKVSDKELKFINEGADADKDKDINEGADADKDKDINEGAEADKDKDINEGADADKDKDINEGADADKDKDKDINEGADADKDKDINEGADADKDKDINEGADADKDKDINEGADADKDKDINEGADADKDKDINESNTDVRADGNVTDTGDATEDDTYSAKLAKEYHGLSDKSVTFENWVIEKAEKDSKITPLVVLTTKSIVAKLETTDLINESAMLTASFVNESHENFLSQQSEHLKLLRNHLPENYTFMFDNLNESAKLILNEQANFYSLNESNVDEFINTRQWSKIANATINESANALTALKGNNIQSKLMSSLKASKGF